VKQIVTRLGGTVDFEDAPGGGTVFHVDLAGSAHVAEREIDLDREADAARILLCADDPNRAIAVREGLRHFGFATDFAHIRADVIKRAAATPYSAIVVDLDLLNGEGTGLIRDLRNQLQNVETPIIGLATDAQRDHDAVTSHDLDGWVDKPVDTDRLAQILDRAMVQLANGQPQVLHVDDDHNVLDVVARALGGTAKVISVDSIDEARRALAAYHFDLAVLDIALGQASGLDLLPDLRNDSGRAIPVIIFSAQSANPAHDPRVQSSLGKSQTALDNLVATVHDRLTPGPSYAAKEIV
jgi:DNA-binding response OmpR family regulator